MDKKITPFHCWTEYYKGKEMVARLMAESGFGKNVEVMNEAMELSRRVLEWENRYLPL